MKIRLRELPKKNTKQDKKGQMSFGWGKAAREQFNFMIRRGKDPFCGDGLKLEGENSLRLFLLQVSF